MSAEAEFLRATWVIARATLLEAVRRKLVISLTVLTLLVLALTGYIYSHIGTIAYGGFYSSGSLTAYAASQVFVLVLFAFSGVLALAAAFISAPTIGSEVESGVALSIVARPISRAAFVLGKWLGLFVLIAAYSALATFAQAFIVHATAGYDVNDPGALTFYMTAIGITVMTLTLLLSSRMGGMPAGLIVIVAFFTCWMLGVAGGFGQALHNDSLRATGTASHYIFPTDGLWRGALFAMEDRQLGPTIGIGQLIYTDSPDGVYSNPFYAPKAPDSLYLLWCFVWVGVVLVLAALSFRYREI